jgi:hypothetical protein
VPGILRVLVLTYLSDPVAPLEVQALQNTARALGVTLQGQDIRVGIGTLRQLDVIALTSAVGGQADVAQALLK